MKFLLDEVSEVANGVWLTVAAPHQLTKFDDPKTARGSTSVLLASSPLYDRDKGHLVLDLDGVVVLNVGTTPRTVVLDTIYSTEALEAQQRRVLEESGGPGPGDNEFLALAETELQGEAQEVAIDLIRAVRSKWAGDLKRGQRNNFSNTPDNFFYVIIQPRVQALSITVRGSPERFRPSTLELKVDRPGYTRFQIKTPDELPEAMRLIEQSKRR
jgi:hypothetical protein